MALHSVDLIFPTVYADTAWLLLSLEIMDRYNLGSQVVEVLSTAP